MNNYQQLSEDEAAPWAGRVRQYDLIKEGVTAMVVIAIIVVVLATLFGSPDDKQITFRQWATNAPADFYSTTVHELAGTSDSAGYGAPYNKASSGVNLGPLHLAQIAGVTHPVDTVNDFVITPLSTFNNSPSVTSALARWGSADSTTQGNWARAYDSALTEANGDPSKIAKGQYGAVPELATGLLAMAKTGSLDGVLLSQGQYFQNDNTKQTLFLGDGSYFNDQSTAANLQGDTWGMMNETGRYPGQAWLWLYSFWYQIPPFNNGDNHPIGANADAYIMVIMGLLSLGLVVMPLIPGVKSLPRIIPIHRLIWRNYYQEENL
jgi:hypothetical protein